MNVGKDDYDPFSVYELAETGMFTLGGPRRPLHRCRIVVGMLGFRRRCRAVPVRGTGNAAAREKWTRIAKQGPAVTYLPDESKHGRCTRR
jgi:hypothetical protein